MFEIRTPEQFIEKIRAIDYCVKSIRLSEIIVDKSSNAIKYVFICDQTVSEEVQKKLWYEVRKLTPKTVERVSVKVNKIVSNAELVANEIYKYLLRKSPSASVFLKPTDVIVSTVGDVVKYVVRTSADCSDYLKKSGIFTELNAYLGHKFCSDFAGSTDVKEVDEQISLLDEEVFVSEIEKVEHRTIRVEDVLTIDDVRMGDVAQYIEDVPSGYATVCGRITEIREKTTKTGKPFFIITIDDTTATMSGMYFTKKNTCDKIRALVVGDAIIARINVGEWQGKPSTTFEKINKCTFPSDFVKKDKFKKRVPKEYKTVFPEPAETVKVASVFDDVDVPSEMIGKTYVVFDLETTGLDVMNNGITEIGAVKIVDGVITEQFQTLVKPDYPISDEIIKITGITPAMVEDSPKIGVVVPDFMKFIDGAILVAHNAEFDLKFMRRFAGAEEYEIKNSHLDTVELSRKYLPELRRNDLATIAEHFGIVFRHHRALSDAYATAEALIEIMKIKAKKEK